MRRPADTHVDVNAGARPGAGDDAADVAVRDQLDPGTDRTDLGDQPGVARPVEDADGQIADLDAPGTRQFLEVAFRALVDVDDIRRQLGAHGQLVHIDVGRIEEAAVAGDRHDRQRVGFATGNGGAALERHDRDIHGRTAATHPFADIQVFGLSTGALADADGAVDRDLGQRPVHGRRRGFVGGAFVPASDQVRRRQGGRFGGAYRLHYQAETAGGAVHDFPPTPASGPQNGSMRIITGCSTDAFRAAISSSAPTIADSSVSWVVITTGTGSPGDRPRCSTASMETL